jgi:hypothetical protein
MAERMTPEQLRQLNETPVSEWTPEQLQQVEARALRIGRGMHPGDEAKARQFQTDYMNALAVAQLEEITGKAVLSDDVVLKQ